MTSEAKLEEALRLLIQVTLETCDEMDRVTDALNAAPHTAKTRETIRAVQGELSTAHD